jgi:hypothetical protein
MESRIADNFAEPRPPRTRLRTRLTREDFLGAEPASPSRFIGPPARIVPETLLRRGLLVEGSWPLTGEVGAGGRGFQENFARNAGNYWRSR